MVVRTAASSFRCCLVAGPSHMVPSPCTADRFRSRHRRATDALRHEPHNNVMMHVDVAGVGHTFNGAKELAGNAIVGPMSLPTGGRLAWIADFEGTMVG